MNLIMGIVRKVRKMQKQCLLIFYPGSRMNVDNNMKIEDALAMIANKHPDEIIEYSEREEDSSLLLRLSLATNKMWNIEDFDTVPIGEMDKIFQQCKDVLGWRCEPFFQRLRDEYIGSAEGTQVEEEVGQLSFSNNKVAEVRKKLKGRKYLRNLLEEDTYYKKIARWKHVHCVMGLTMKILQTLY